MVNCSVRFHNLVVFVHGRVSRLQRSHIIGLMYAGRYLQPGIPAGAGYIFPQKIM